MEKDRDKPEPDERSAENKGWFERWLEALYDTHKWEYLHRVCPNYPYCYF